MTYGPMSLSGHPLQGSALVRFIYIDEAGISAHEPATIVVGVIINADNQWRATEAAVNELFDTAVPPSCAKALSFMRKTSFTAARKLIETVGPSRIVCGLWLRWQRNRDFWIFPFQ